MSGGRDPRADSRRGRETNARLSATNADVAALAKRQTETEVRPATEIVEVARAVSGVRDLLRERLDDRERVDGHERRIRSLERRRRAG